MSGESEDHKLDQKLSSSKYFSFNQMDIDITGLKVLIQEATEAIT